MFIFLLRVLPRALVFCKLWSFERHFCNCKMNSSAFSFISNTDIVYVSEDRDLGRGVGHRRCTPRPTPPSCTCWPAGRALKLLRPPTYPGGHASKVLSRPAAPMSAILTTSSRFWWVFFLNMPAETGLTYACDPETRPGLP